MCGSHWQIGPRSEKENGKQKLKMNTGCDRNFGGLWAVSSDM